MLSVYFLPDFWLAFFTFRASRSICSSGKERFSPWKTAFWQVCQFMTCLYSCGAVVAQKYSVPLIWKTENRTQMQDKVKKRTFHSFTNISSPKYLLSLKTSMNFGFLFSASYCFLFLFNPSSGILSKTFGISFAQFWLFITWKIDFLLI